MLGGIVPTTGVCGVVPFTVKSLYGPPFIYVVLSSLIDHVVSEPYLSVTMVTVNSVFMLVKGAITSISSSSPFGRVSVTPLGKTTLAVQVPGVVIK